MDEIDIIVSGLLCLDLIPRMDHIALGELATPGRLFEVGPLDISTGGAVSNTGLALHRLGVNVRLIATVGDDLIGRIIIAFLKDRNPALGELIAVRPGLASAYTIVLTPERVDRIFLHCPESASAFDIDDIDFPLIGKARIFHLGYPPILPRLIADDGEQLAAIFQQAKAMGAVTSCDMAVPDPQGKSGQADWPKILRRALPYIDIFIPSVEEILFMLRRADFDAWGSNALSYITADYLSALAGELLDMGSAIVGFKLGAMGLYVRTAGLARLDCLHRLPLNRKDWANIREWRPAFQAKVVNTTGAGDSCYAGFLTAMLHGMNPADAVRWGNAAGACAVETADATSGVRSWEAIERRMESGWAVEALQLPGYVPS